MSPQELLLLNAAVGILIPLLVAVVTAKVSSPKVKSSVLLALSAVAGYLTTLLAGNQEVDWKNVAVAILTIFVAAAASFFGFTKPAGLAGSDGVIQAKSPRGIGKAA